MLNRLFSKRSHHLSIRNGRKPEIPVGMFGRSVAPKPLPLILCGVKQNAKNVAAIVKISGKRLRRVGSVD